MLIAVLHSNALIATQFGVILSQENILKLKQVGVYFDRKLSFITSKNVYLYIKIMKYYSHSIPTGFCGHVFREYFRKKRNLVLTF